MYHGEHFITFDVQPFPSVELPHSKGSVVLNSQKMQGKESKLKIFRTITDLLLTTVHRHLFYPMSIANLLTHHVFQSSQRQKLGQVKQPYSNKFGYASQLT